MTSAQEQPLFEEPVAAPSQKTPSGQEKKPARTASRSRSTARKPAQQTGAEPLLSQRLEAPPAESIKTAQELQSTSERQTKHPSRGTKPAKKASSQRASPKKRNQGKKPATISVNDSGKKQATQRYAKEARLENEHLKKYLSATDAKALKTHLGIETVGEFLEFYPRKYLPRGELSSFANLVEGSQVSIIARVVKVSTRQLRARRGSLTEVIITDQLTDDVSEEPNTIFQDSAVQRPRADYRFAPSQGTAQGHHPRIMGSASGYSDNFGILPSAMANGYLQDSPFADYVMGAPSTRMTLSFFNAWTAAREIYVGDQVMFSGKVGSYRGELTLTNPHYAVLTENRADTVQTPQAIERAKQRATAPIPVYRASAKLPTDRIATAMETLLDSAPLAELEDPIPAQVRSRRKIPSLSWTYRAVHTPDTEETWRAAQHFLRFREAFVLQSALARIREARAAHSTVARPLVQGGLADQLLEILPYSLTAGQESVGQEISADLGSQIPMNRLLQGDVGSGKTVVALRAMLQVVDNGAQAAMLAPTEVLAEQHYRSVLEILGSLTNDTVIPSQEVGAAAGEKPAVHVVLLKASLPAAVKKKALVDIASGAADIVIGTHALLADAVSFAELGMVVVDEQHRFGVEQRDALRGAGGELPHRLVMTATPIPRTVAMTVFGDLDTSVLNQLPAGRQKIQTVVVPLKEHPTWERRIWQRAREEIDAGHQVYVVVPKIGEGDTDANLEDDGGLYGSPSTDVFKDAGPQLNSVSSMMAELADIPALIGTRVAALHGRMDAAEKAQTMQDFSEGQIDLLVCTTVIEVGVNVPNATLMIIMDADRFGISGLHQLRGRIGRGSLPGTCLLVTTQESDGVSRERLAAVASSTDGFELSRIDLEQRREGDILGAAQSGKKSTLKLLRALTDAKLIEQAREDAREIVSADPMLAQHPDLARTIDRALDADREAFLGRG